MPLDPARFGARSWSEWFGGKAIPLVFWSLLAFLAFRALGVSPEGPEPPGPELWLGIARRVLTLAFFLLIVWAYLIRSRLAAPAQGFRERAYPMLVFFGGIAGVFVLQVLELPRRFDFGWSGLLVALPGLALSLWALLHLKRSFSILAEARQVVTTGPYRRIRHPLYLGEALTMLGLCLEMGNLPAMAFWVVFNALQLGRARIEEEKLARSFPEYAAYRTRTRFILPGIY